MSNISDFIVGAISALLTAAQLYVAILTLRSGQHSMPTKSSRIINIFTGNTTINAAYIGKITQQPKDLKPYIKKYNIVLSILTLVFALALLVFFSRESSVIILLLHTFSITFLTYRFCTSGKMTCGIRRSIYYIYLFAILLSTATAVVVLKTPGIVSNTFFNNALLFLFIFGEMCMFTAISHEMIKSSVGYRFDYHLVIITLAVLAFIGLIIAGKSDEFSLTVSNSITRLVELLIDKLNNPF